MINEQEWKPKYGHLYYSFDAFYNVVEKDWMNDLLDQARKDMNIVFATKQIAEFEREKRIVKEELETYAQEYNDRTLKEWNGHNTHHVIIYDGHDDTLITCRDTELRCESATYFTSEEIAKNAIETIGEDRIKKYLFGIKYKEKTEC